jgi:site-specific recombinase XerD
MILNQLTPTTSTASANPALLTYFAKYLANGQNRGDQDYNRKVSRASLKNYLSDIHLFLAWISRTLQQEEILAANITAPVMDNYRSHLLRRLSPAAAKRHLSSLRLFGRFLINTNRTNEDPAKNLYAPTDASGAVVAAEPVPTLSKITADFAGYLKHENLTNTTIKNYLSDVHRYLLWAKENLGLTDNNLDLRNTN